MKKLDVYLLGHKCGELVQSAQGDLKFNYCDGYDLTPLSLSMPTARVQHPKSKVLPYLQGLLPDSPDALRAIARRFLVSEKNPFAMLEHIGADVAGAVEFRALDKLPSESVRLQDSDVAALLNQQITEYSTGNPGVARGQFSLAGAQPKLALHRDVSGDWWTSSDDKPSTHILKPSPPQLPMLHLAELLTMRLAMKLGLKTAKTELASFGGTRVLIAQRFDRVRLGDRVEKLHQEDLCQALAVMPSRKYQKYDAGPGVGQIANLLKTIPSANRSGVARDFFAGLAFNILVRATDAHAKNYSLLLQDKEVALAPLYDLISGAALETATESAMSIQGAYSFEQITDTAVIREGERLGVSDAAELVAELRDQFEPALNQALSELLTEHPGESAALTELAERIISGVRT